MCWNHCSPRDHIRIGHLVTHSPHPLHGPMFSIHVNKDITHKKIINQHFEQSFHAYSRTLSVVLHMHLVLWQKWDNYSHAPLYCVFLNYSTWTLIHALILSTFFTCSMNMLYEHALWTHILHICWWVTTTKLQTHKFHFEYQRS